MNAWNGIVRKNSRIRIGYGTFQGDGSGPTSGMKNALPMSSIHRWSRSWNVLFRKVRSYNPLV